MNTQPFRLLPGQDLRYELETLTRDQDWRAACVIAAVGSLSRATIRFAGRDDPAVLEGPLEITALSGTLSPDGCHLHLSVADGEGETRGGHLLEGSVVHTTVEVVVAVLEHWSFSRELDPDTGYRELMVRALGNFES